MISNNSYVTITQKNSRAGSRGGARGTVTLLEPNTFFFNLQNIGKIKIESSMDSPPNLAALTTTYTAQTALKF